MPGLVNPQPDTKSHTLAKGIGLLKNGSSGKNTDKNAGKNSNTQSQQSSNVMSPDLLKGGGTFSANGPAGSVGGIHGAATTRGR